MPLCLCGESCLRDLRVLLLSAAPIALLATSPSTLTVLLETLTLQAGYNATVVILGTTLLGIAAGVIGCFALLRKRSLMGDALAHATLPGIAAAFLVATWLGAQGRSMPILLLGAVITGVLGVICVQLIIRHTRLSEDTAIGTVLSVFFGLGVVLLSYLQSIDRGTVGGLNHFIYGQTAAMSRGDAVLIGAVAAGAILAALLLLKEFRVVCFDDRFGQSIGIPIWLVDLLMMSLVVIVTVIGLQAVGLILIVAMLIIPPAAARFWTERLSRMVAISAAIGGASGYLGSSISALAPGLPAGSIIVLTAGGFFLLSMLLAPTRGIIAAAVRAVRLQLHIARDHLLRDLYEILETDHQLQPHISVSTTRVTTLAAISPPVRFIILRWLHHAGLVARTNHSLALTPAGLADAARITRNHRLWEEYLVRHADIAPTHVDRSADMVEHILSPELIRELEQSISSATAATPRPIIPPSVHPVTRDEPGGGEP